MIKIANTLSQEELPLFVTQKIKTLLFYDERCRYYRTVIKQILSYLSATEREDFILALLKEREQKKMHFSMLADIFQPTLSEGSLTFAELKKATIWQMVSSGNDITAGLLFYLGMLLPPKIAAHALPELKKGLSKYYERTLPNEVEDRKAYIREQKLLLLSTFQLNIAFASP